MTKLAVTTLTALFAAMCHDAAAQQPPRPAETPRTVTLSVTEYNRLIDLAARPPQNTTQAPVAAVLSSADLRVRVDRETASGSFRVVGDVLRPGVAKVALLSGATLVGATTGGRPLPLVAEGTTHTALLPGPGLFTLNLDWGAPLTFAPGKGSFVLPALSAGSVQATIDLPSEQADLRLSSGLVTRRTTNGGRTIVEATLTPGTSTEVSWSMRDSAPAAAARETRAMADVMTLITLGDADVRMVALVDVTIVQGEPKTIELRLPVGYELTSISGGTLDKSDQDGTVVTLTVTDPSVRRHQFLVSLDRPHGVGSFTLETGVASVSGVLRERGEIAIEAVGTVDLTTADRDGMHRIDVRELQPALRSLARAAVLSAFRYQRISGMTPGLTLEAKRFADAGVLAAYAEHATATTMITAEGRALTEVVLELQNRAQPFMKVNLPEDASIVSVEVAGAAAKPVLAADGVRVPLLRPGFKPNGTYNVSFVYLNAGTPFAKKGDVQMTLPKVDVPIGQTDWEVFAPDTYVLRTTGGNVIEQPVLDREIRVRLQPVVNGAPGEIHGRVTDASGADMPGVTIELVAGPFKGSTVTNSKGGFVLMGVPNGRVTLMATLVGFQTERRDWYFDRSPVRVDFQMKVGSVAETITVAGNAPRVDTQRDLEDSSKRLVEPSQDVVNLQQRAAGVLPVRIDVPKAGTSHRFVKPLVVDEETVVFFSYKRR